MEEKGAGREIALTREKTIRSVVRISVTLPVVQTPWRATVESGFLSARYALRIVTCAPVEYLTYEIRNISDLMRLVGGDAHIDPRLLLRSVGADALAQPSGAPERYGCGTPLAGAVRPPRRRRGTLFRIHRKYRFYSDTVTVPPAAYFFLSCQKKVCKKEAQDAKIALTRRKTNRSVLRIFVTPSVIRTPFGRPSNRVS